MRSRSSSIGSSRSGSATTIIATALSESGRGSRLRDTGETTIVNAWRPDGRAKASAPPPPPVASDGTLTTAEDTPAAGSLNATDPNGAPLTYSIVSNGALGTAALTNPATGAFTYTPAANANGPDTFTFKANNGSADSNVATISVTISPVNDAPVASAGNLGTNEDTPTAGTLMADDVDGPSLTLTILNNGTLGTATITNAATGAYTYTPNQNASGDDTFTFQASDGTLTSNTATVTVAITPVNDPPVAQNGVLAVTTGASAAGTLVATDIDGPALTYAIASNGTKGTAVVTNAATGAYTYTANAGTSGADTFTFTASDGSLASNPATVTVSITGGTQPPVASDGAISTPEDRSMSGTLVGSDPERSRVTFSLVSNGSKGTATITNASNGRFTYVPAANANGVDSFAFKVNDGVLDSNVATVTVTIAPVNDAPDASNATLTTSRNTPANGTMQAADVDGDALTFSIARGPRRGTLTLTDATTGAFTYTPNANFAGNDAFTYRVTDGTATVSATISIVVTR